MRVCHRRGLRILPVDFIASEIRQTTLTKRVFLIVDGFTQKAFSLSRDPSSEYLTYVSGLDRSRTQVGRPSRHGNRRDRGRLRLKFNILKFTWLFCLDRKMSKRQNEKTMRRQNSLQTADFLAGSSFKNRSSQKTIGFCFVKGFRCTAVPLVHFTLYVIAEISQNTIFT